MFIVDWHHTAIVFGIIGILLFVVQLIVCFISNITKTKHIFRYKILLFGLFATIYYISLFGIGNLQIHNTSLGAMITITSLGAMVSLGTISLIFFAIQLRFCFTREKIARKLIPVHILLSCLLLAALLYSGIFGRWGGGFIGGGEKFLAYFLAAGAGVASVGVAIAWIVYGLNRKR